MQAGNNTLRAAEHALTLEFSEAGPAPATRCGPYKELRADAENLRDGRGGELIARHQDHCWYVTGRRFFRIDCDRPVNVHFEDADGGRSTAFGPFLHFSSADGIAYVDGEIIGHVDVDACLWYSHREQRHWKEIVVAPAG